MRRLRSMTSSPSWTGSHGALSRPTPCSPVMVPPMPIARSMTSPNASWARAARSGSSSSRTMIGWVLPSPAWATSAIGMSRRAEISSIPATSCGSAGSGTPTSSSSSEPTLPRLVNAARRATVNCSPSSGSSVANTSVAPFARNASEMSSVSAARSAPVRSDCASSIAPAEVSSPIRRSASTARIETLSMNSSIAGRMRLVIASTASLHATTSGKIPTTVERGGCSGRSRTMISVTIPSVPSLPTNSLVRLSPAVSLRRAPPRRTAVPSARTTVIPST